ncbi:MAG TPA: hypothetical protein VMX18_00400 [Candidatus Bipolaricaulota bacterium]|nr:hypothetical protein [Candidatus Bipolaricaulota bacterium]
MCYVKLKGGKQVHRLFFLAVLNQVRTLAIFYPEAFVALRQCCIEPGQELPSDILETLNSELYLVDVGGNVCPELRDIVISLMIKDG